MFQVVFRDMLQGKGLTSSHPEPVDNMFHQGNSEQLIINPLLILMDQLAEASLELLEMLAMLSPELFQINTHQMCALAMLGQDIQQLIMLHQSQLGTLNLDQSEALDNIFLQEWAAPMYKIQV